MLGDIKVTVDSCALEEYGTTLAQRREQMNAELLSLCAAYLDAEWNDMVSEKVRQKLNQYIAEYNRASASLEAVIRLTEQLCDALDGYASAGK